MYNYTWTEQYCPLVQKQCNEQIMLKKHANTRDNNMMKELRNIQ